MLKTVVLIITILILGGCGQVPRKQLTREEWAATTSREYRGLSKEQVLAAAEKLFRLADGDDFRIVHMDDGLHASRNWTSYAVVVIVAGTDYWDFKATESEGSVKASVRVNTQSQSTSPMQTGRASWAPMTSATEGAPVDGTALYDVFWARMDYLLGLRPAWMTCEEADARVKQRLTWGNNEPLCNSFNLDDRIPDGPLLTDRKTWATQ